MTYTIEEGPRNYGDATGAYVLVINIMQTSLASIERSKTMFDYIDDMVQKVVNDSRTSFAGGQTRRISTDNFMNDCSSRQALTDDANAWLSDNGLSDTRGVYLWAHTCDGRNFANGMAWDSGYHNAFVCTDDYSGEDLGAISIQEGLHPYIDRGNCNRVQDLTGPGTNEAEHNLGIVKPGTFEVDATPMCASYPDRCSQGADKCVEDNTPLGWSSDLAGCTVDAVELSYQHTDTNGTH